MTRSLSLALVSPRFEPVTAVGAEVQTAELARRLAARGHRVEVLTTCVRDDLTWKNHYDAGLYDEGSFTVRRFPADARRVTRGVLEAGRRLRRGETLSLVEEERWIGSRGASTALERHIAERGKGVDLFIFTPVAAGTTGGGLPLAGGRALLIPALRSDGTARLATVAGLLRQARLLLAGSESERELIVEGAGVERSQVRLGAAAVEAAAEYRPERFRERHGLEVPFLLYAGRRRVDKGVDRLLEFMALLVREGKLDLRLVLLGTETIAVPETLRDHVLDLHMLDAQAKADGMAAALAFCQPSAAEGLALAPLEAWLAGRPVLASAGGPVTVERCRAGGGGLWYRDTLEFIEGVRLLLEREPLAASMGEGGRHWTNSCCRWEKTLEIIEGTVRLSGSKGAAS